MSRYYEHGYTHITPLYSGMSMVKRIKAFRYARVLGSAYLIDDMTVEIIAAGAHLPGSLLKLVYRTIRCGPAGMPDGESVLGSLKDGQKVIIEDGVAKLMDRNG